MTRLDLSLANHQSRLAGLDISVGLLDLSLVDHQARLNGLDISVGLLDLSLVDHQSRLTGLDISVGLLDVSLVSQDARISALELLPSSQVTDYEYEVTVVEPDGPINHTFYFAGNTITKIELIFTATYDYIEYNLMYNEDVVGISIINSGYTYTIFQTATVPRPVTFFSVVVPATIYLGSYKFYEAIPLSIVAHLSGLDISVGLLDLSLVDHQSKLNGLDISVGKLDLSLVIHQAKLDGLDTRSISTIGYLQVFNSINQVTVADNLDDQTAYKITNPKDPWLIGGDGTIKISLGNGLHIGKASITVSGNVNPSFEYILYLSSPYQPQLVLLRNVDDPWPFVVNDNCISLINGTISSREFAYDPNVTYNELGLGLGSPDSSMYISLQIYEWITPRQAISQVVTPTGTMQVYCGRVAPNGYLLCDGAPVSRTTYSALYAVIGNDFGAGDGIYTFNIPDTRGMFLRGAGTQTVSNRTYAASMGVVYVDTMQGHAHQVVDPGHDHDIPVTAPEDGAYITATDTGNTGGTKDGHRTATAPTMITVSGAITDNVNGTPRVSFETRPVNLGINYIIKT